MILKQDGSVWSTGVHSDVQNERFQQVISTGATAVSAGNSFGTVLTQDGSVMITGKDFKGKVSSVGTLTKSRRTFSYTQRISGAKAVGAGGEHILVLTEDRVWAMGCNKYGQLGDGSLSDKNKFSRVLFSTVEFVAVAAGEMHSIVLKQDGSVLITGRNYNGQLGDGSKSDRIRFAKLISNGVVDVSAGSYHSMIIKEDSSVWTTGWNEYGQLGDGTTTDRTNYIRVMKSGAKAVAAGRQHSMVLKQDGSVWVTGYT